MRFYVLVNRNQEFVARERPIYRRMVECLRVLTPRHWRRAVLHMEASYEPIWKTRSITHRLVNPEDGMEIEDLPAELLDLTTELHALYGQFDQVWRRCRVELEFVEPGRLKRSTANFDYGQGLPDIGASPSGQP